MGLINLINNLPDELIGEIKSFIYVKCKKCLNLYISETGVIRYEIFGYLSVFDDDFDLWLDNNMFNMYNFLCEECIYNFRTKHFIVRKVNKRNQDQPYLL